MDGWMDGWICVCIYIYIYTHLDLFISAFAYGSVLFYGPGATFEAWTRMWKAMNQHVVRRASP